MNLKNFKFFSKKNHDIHDINDDGMTDQTKAAYARVEAMNNGTTNIDKEYKEAMKRIEDEEKTQKTSTGYFGQRFQQFNVSRRNSYSSQVAREEAANLLQEFQTKGLTESPQVSSTPKNVTQNTIHKPINDTIQNPRVSEKVPRPEDVIEMELTKLREMGIPEEIIQEFRNKDLEYIKEHRGIASEEAMTSRIKEVYQRFNDPAIVNIYRLSPEEFLVAGLASLQELGLSEEKAEEIKQKLLNSIDLYKQHNFSNHSINEEILFKLSSLKSSILKAAHGQEKIEKQDNSMKK